MWKHLLAFMTAANFNHGPLRSGTWFSDTGEALDFHCATHKLDDEAFQEQLHRIAHGFKMEASDARGDRASVRQHVQSDDVQGEGPGAQAAAVGLHSRLLGLVRAGVASQPLGLLRDGGGRIFRRFER